MKKETRKKAAIYTRVSTDMQADKDSLPMQRRDLEGYCEYVLGVTDHVIFEDAGFSGKDLNRPAFQEMIRRCRDGEFSHVVVWKLDRISRNLIDFIQLYEELQKLGITFVSKNEQFDTSTAMGVAMLQILLVFAQLERGMTAERVRATMISRAAQGTWNGGRVPFGYDYDKESNTFSVNENEAYIVKTVYEDYLKKRSVAEIVKEMNRAGIRTRAGNEWTPTTIWDILKNPWYIGTYRYNRYRGTVQRTENAAEEVVYVADHHPAIITEEQYGQAQEIMKANRRYDVEGVYMHRNWSEHIFRSLIRCEECMRRMTGVINGKDKNGYNKISYRCDMARHGLCDGKGTSEHIVGNVVMNYLKNLWRAKEHFSLYGSNREKFAASLIVGTAFRKIETIDENSVNDIWDTLRRFRSDTSYKFEGMGGRMQKKTDPETEALKQERRRLHIAFERLNDAYLYRKRIMPESEFSARREGIIQRLKEIDAKLGRIRQTAVDVASTEKVYKAIADLFSIPLLRKGHFVDYKKIESEVDHVEVRDILERIIDSVWVKNGKVTRIVLLDGSQVRFNYYEQFK